MKIKNKEGYDDWYNNQSDGYGRRCFTYAEEWANMMEAELTTLDKERVNKLSDIADTDAISGFMFGAAKSILVNHWQYGDYLKYIDENDTNVKYKDYIKTLRTDKLERILK